MPSRRADVEELLGDLVAEHQDLDGIVSGMPPTTWDTPTPAVGWSVRDQVSHLAFFDDAATTALEDPEGFADMARAALERDGDPMDEHLRRGREMDPGQVLEWWRRARDRMVERARAAPPDARVPWFGPAMSLMSFTTARLMETWAHGQDIADALGVVRMPTDRLRHIAYLGVRTRQFSYLVRGLEPPAGSVHVELESPSGARWSWDDEGSSGEAAPDTVRGSALDFCLVVTQRRNLLDTSLEVHGDLAERWLEIAQAFAGPPGPGRSPRRHASPGANQAR